MTDGFTDGNGAVEMDIVLNLSRHQSNMEDDLSLEGEVRIKALLSLGLRWIK